MNDNSLSTSAVSAAAASFSDVFEAEGTRTTIIEVGRANSLKRTTTSNPESHPAAGADGLWDGYSGEGYFDPGYQIGDGLRFTVTAPEAGTYRLTVRYANGDANGLARPMALSIDGQAAGELAFPPVGTGGWQAWGEEVIEVTLKGGANVIALVNKANDGPNLDQIVVSSTDAAANSPPAFVGLPSAITVPEGQLSVADVDATDADSGQTLSYSLVGSADAALFAIDAVSGVLTFKTAPDFENPADADGDNVYDVVVGVSDGIDTTMQDVLVTVSDEPEGSENSAPVFTSPTSATAAENQLAVQTVAATDSDAGQTLSYAVAGGTDAALFAIDSVTGALTFKTAPNFEAPADADGDNVYHVTVSVSDGLATTTQDLLVTVSDEPENSAPVFTSSASAIAAENQLVVQTVAANDPDAGQTLSYAVAGGVDAALFAIDAVTGALTFITAPDYEAPADADGDNIYHVTVSASDGIATTTQDLLVTVSDEPEGSQNSPPVFTSPASVTAAENQLAALTVAASDADAGQTLSFSVAGGVDAALFAIDAVTGALTFITAPDYEAPADADGDNIYQVTVSASDGIATTTQDVLVSITDVSEGVAPFIDVIEAEGTRATIIEVGAVNTLKRTSTTNPETNPAAGPDKLWDGYSGEGYLDLGGQIGDGVRLTVTAPEAGTYRFAVRYANGDAHGLARPMTLSIDGRAAGELPFAATGTGTLAWEAWAEATIEITLKAGANVITLANKTKNGPNLDQIVVTNADAGVNSPPAFVGLPFAIMRTEGSLAVINVDAVDADAGQTLTYSIAGGADAALFDINSASGQITFKAVPDFEAPADADGNNVYDIVVGVSDGIDTTTRSLTVKVADGPDGAFNYLIEGESPLMTIVEVGPVNTLQRTFGSNLETNPAAGPDGLWDGFSGRGYLDGGAQVGDGVNFTVDTPGAGEYRLVIRYANGDSAGASRPMLLSVDGASAGEIAFASTGTTDAGWEAWTETANTLTLKAGANQVGLFNKGTAAPNIDWLAVQSVAVNLPPVFQQLPAQVSVAENGTPVIDVNASDPDPQQTLTYSISGPDAAKFTINPITGNLVFNQAPDFEKPGDAGANNVYDLTVAVSDGAATTTQALAVTVTDVVEVPPATTEPGPRQTIQVNFQDGTAPKAAGYLIDNFQGYADRGNGFSYGWVTEASATDADGTSATPINGANFPAIAINERAGAPFDSYDARLTGYAHFDLASYPARAAWEISLPNGWYEVTAAVGDTGGANDSIYKLQIEGVLVSDYRPTDQFKTELVTQIVQVSDGFLTLAAPGGTVTEIQYLQARILPDLTPGDGRDAPADYAQFVNPRAVAQEGSQIFAVGLDPASGFASGIDPKADLFLGISVAENRGGVLLASLRDGSFQLTETLTGAPVAITANTTGGADSVTITPNVTLKPFTSYTLVVDGAQDRGSNDDAAAPPREFQKFTTTFLTGAERVPEAREVAFDDTLLINGATTFSPDYQPLDGGFLYTSLELAPDGRYLYVATLNGDIMRFAINPATGGVNYANREVFTPHGDFDVNGARRGIVGLTFDPENADVIWITDNLPVPLEGRSSATPDFSGRVSKVTLGSNGDLASATIETYVTGLPRSNGDHITNSLEFRANPEFDQFTNPSVPKHLLYLTQGSNSAMGEADSAWGFRPERLLSAAVLEIDPTRSPPSGGFNVASEPLPADGLNRRFADSDGNLKNGGISITSGEYQGKFLHFAADGVASVRDGALPTSTLVKEFYNPFATDAVVKLFAAGTRNAYDLVWHSDGNLYIPTNGSAAGGSVPNDPSTPANERLTGVSLQSDYFFKVEEGGYYGHPNPLLDNFIMNGGNPTLGIDRNEVTNYAPGTQPDSNYRLNDTYSLGNNRSPNGVAEYTSDVFGASLEHGVIFTEYSGGNDLRALLLDANGAVRDDFVIKRPDGTVIQEYVDPLDVVVNPQTGQIYMLTLDRSSGRSQVVLLDPRPGAEIGDTTADEGGDLALAAIDTTDRAATVFTVAGLDPDIIGMRVSFDGGATSQVVTLDAQSRFTLDLTGLGTGPKNATLIVDDNAGNSAQTSASFTLTAPPADTSADEDGNLALVAIDTSNRAAAIFEATGVDADIQSITVQISAATPQAVALGTDGRFTLDLGTATGNVAVTLRVTDDAANTASAATQITLAPPADTSADEDGNLALVAIDTSNRAAAIFEARGVDADIQSLTVQIGAATPQAVTLGTDGRFTLDLGAASGQFAVTLRVTDDAANTASAATQVTLAPSTDAQITVQSLDAAFFDNRLHFNWIQNPRTIDSTGQQVANRDYKESGVVQFSNDGTSPLQITSHQISGPFTLANPAALNNLTLAPGQSVDVTVNFNRGAYTAPTGDGAVANFSGQLKLTTNDSDTPVATVDLAGFYQSVNEGGREPNLNEVWQAFGFGNFIEGLSRNRSGGDSVLNFFDLYIPEDSTEILNPYFRIADGVTTARITQIAAFHGPIGANLAIHNPSNKGGVVASINHDTTQSQSFLPLSGANFNTTTFTNATIPNAWAGNDVFGVRVGGLSTNPLLNPTGSSVVTQSALNLRHPGYSYQAGVSGAEPKVFDQYGNEVPTGYTVRVFEAVDKTGVVVPNTYLIAMDYTGINYDYNDNVIVIEGVTPVSMADISLRPLENTGDRLVMNYDPGPTNLEDAVVRISNDAATGLPGPQGMGVLRIQSVTVADPTLFQIVSTGNLSNVTLAPGGTLDVTVRYIGTGAASSAMLESALIVRSNDFDESVINFDLVGLPERGAFVTGVNYGGGAIASDPVLGVPLKAPTLANGVTMSTTRTPGTDGSHNQNGTNATPGSAFKTYQDAPNWTTTIDVPNGTYIVAVHTQETYWNQPAKRIFDVTVNGQQIADDLDPFVAAGNKGDTPVILETLVTVTDGKVTILLDALAPDGVDMAAINAVTIYQVSAPSQQAAMMRIPPASTTDSFDAAMFAEQPEALSIASTSETGDNISVLGTDQVALDSALASEDAILFSSSAETSLAAEPLLVVPQMQELMTLTLNPADYGAQEMYSAAMFSQTAPDSPFQLQSELAL